MYNEKKNLIWIFTFLLLVNSAYAVTINSGTFINSTGLNHTINFTATAYADEFIVANDSIYFENYSRDNLTEVLTFNITNVNRSHLGTDLPYFSTAEATTDSKTITSNLTDSINATAIFTVESCNIRRINFQSTSGATDDRFTSGWVCDSSALTTTLDIDGIENGENSLLITYNECTTYERIFYPLILLFAALSIVGLALFVTFKGNDGFSIYNVTLKKLLISFILIMITIALIQVIGDSINLRCAL